MVHLNRSIGIDYVDISENAVAGSASSHDG